MTLPTRESFLHDVRDHKLTIIRDDGIYRHLRLQKPGDRNAQFDMVTWPGYLAYCGDMGDYVFSRIRDMFQLFRHDEGEINPQYWAEKCDAVGKNDGIKKFSEEKFNRAAMEYLVQWIRDHKHETTKDRRRYLWRDVVDEVIGADGDAGGFNKMNAVNDFVHKWNTDVGVRSFLFQDFWETDVDEYTYRYIWCCHAIVWGIQKYDEAKEAVA